MPRKISDEEIEQIKRRHAEGWAAREIARELGRSQVTVCKYLPEPAPPAAPPGPGCLGPTLDDLKKSLAGFAPEPELDPEPAEPVDTSAMGPDQVREWLSTQARRAQKALESAEKRGDDQVLPRLLKLANELGKQLRACTPTESAEETTAVSKKEITAAAEKTRERLRNIITARRARRR